MNLPPCICGAAGVVEWIAGKGYFGCCTAKDCTIETQGVYPNQQAAALAWASMLKGRGR